MKQALTKEQATESTQKFPAALPSLTPSIFTAEYIMTKGTVALFAAAHLILLTTTSVAQPQAPQAEARITPTNAQTPTGREFSREILTGTTVWSFGAAPGWVSGIGAVLDFNADGTGTSSENVQGSQIDAETVPEPFTWAVVDGSVTIQFLSNAATSYPSVFSPFSALIENYGFDQSVADFLIQV